MIRNSIIALVIFLIVYFAFLRPEDPFKTIDMPQALIGEWTTEAPNYAGRSFKLDKMTVTFDLGDDGARVYPLVKLKQRMEGSREYFEVVYGQNSEPEQILRFDYRRAEGGTIHISHQKNVVWTRHEAP
jgi:hypothetical protein